MRTSSQAVPIPSPASFYGPNTIALSTDMSTIYLIDSGRAIPFSLDTIGGLLIGVVGGQLTVVSSISFPPKIESTNFLSLATTTREATEVSSIKTIEISTSKQRIALSFNVKPRPVCVIGVTDIDVGIKPEEDMFKPIEIRGFGLDLTFNFLNISKEGEVIRLTTMPYKGTDATM